MPLVVAKVEHFSFTQKSCQRGLGEQSYQDSPIKKYPQRKTFVFCELILTKFEFWETIFIMKKTIFMFLKVILIQILDRLESFFKDNLDVIPSTPPSVKIQIMGGKVCLRRRGKKLLGAIKKLLKTKRRWRWCDQIQAFFLNLFYFTKAKL